MQLARPTRKVLPTWFPAAELSREQIVLVRRLPESERSKLGVASCDPSVRQCRDRTGLAWEVAQRGRVVILLMGKSFLRIVAPGQALPQAVQ